MTEDRIVRQDLIGKSADTDVLHEMVGFAAQRLMEPEVEALPTPAMANARTSD